MQYKSKISRPYKQCRVHWISLPSYWPSILAQRKGNNYELSHLLLVISFSEIFKVIYALLGCEGEPLWSWCLLTENSLNYVGNQPHPPPQKKSICFCNLEKLLRLIQKIILKISVLIELSLYQPSFLSEKMCHLSWVTMHLNSHKNFCVSTSFLHQIRLTSS